MLKKHFNGLINQSIKEFSCRTNVLLISCNSLAGQFELTALIFAFILNEIIVVGYFISLLDVHEVQNHDEVVFKRLILISDLYDIL